MTEEEKLAFYKSEFHGAALSAHLTFRCTEPLAVWLKSKGLAEARDYSSVIRRLVIRAAQEEGFDRNAV